MTTRLNRLIRSLPVASALACATLAGSAWSQAKPLTVVSWGGAYQDAQREVFFKPYTAKSGVKVVDESWDGGVGVLRAKIQGGANNWDLVCRSNPKSCSWAVKRACSRSSTGPKIGGRDAYLPEATNECGVGAILYNFVLAFDGDKFKGAAPPVLGRLSSDTAKFPGKRALR